MSTAGTHYREFAEIFYDVRPPCPQCHWSLDPRMEFSDPQSSKQYSFYRVARATPLAPMVQGLIHPTSVSSFSSELAGAAAYYHAGDYPLPGMDLICRCTE